MDMYIYIMRSRLVSKLVTPVGKILIGHHGREMKKE